jgi:inorganic pyrophosphatase
MDFKKISCGMNPPEDINIIIEIPLGGPPVKYEIDKDSGALFVNRFWNTAMHYPANYGFIPYTLASDGDPLDALVIGNIPVLPYSVIRATPIGVLFMEDESGVDEKILAKPVESIDVASKHIQSIRDVPEIYLDQIFHFFSHYKDLEKSKWVKVKGWGNEIEAQEIIKKYMLK